jgi:two-component system chemotaxis response regulator CheB
MQGRDIVVIGGSAGALDGVTNIVQGLTPDLKASLFVVMHASEGSTGFLPEIVARRTQLPVRVGKSGDRIRPGQAFLPPVDRHMTIDRGRVRVTRGPRQNRFRPAIDPLFASAALSYGPRVVGIVLSGGMDDGTHGLSQIQRAGGVTVVQDLEEAPVQGMPLAALKSVKVAVRSLEEHAELHRRLASVKGTGRERSGAMKRHADEIERRSHILRRILVERGDAGGISNAPRRRATRNARLRERTKGAE